METSLQIRKSVNMLFCHYCHEVFHFFLAFITLGLKYWFSFMFFKKPVKKLTGIKYLEFQMYSCEYLFLIEFLTHGENYLQV